MITTVVGLRCAQHQPTRALRRRLPCCARFCRLALIPDLVREKPNSRGRKGSVIGGEPDGDDRRWVRCAQHQPTGALRSLFAPVLWIELIPGSFPPHPPSQNAMLLAYCCVERSASGNRAMASPGRSATNDGQPAAVSQL